MLEQGTAYGMLSSRAARKGWWQEQESGNVEQQCGEAGAGKRSGRVGVGKAGVTAAVKR